MLGSDLDQVIDALETHYFGKYRGLVTDNNDPLKQGRIQVRVPSVLGDKLLWALPCTPYAGPDIGFFALPPVGANVWVEFESGELNHPIWAGGFWDPNELPSEAAPGTVFLRTPGAVIRIEDSGTVEIETTGGAKITLTGTEITLEAPTIKQSANGGATQLSASGFDAMNGALTVV
jgi:hypothetical protein